MNNRYQSTRWEKKDFKFPDFYEDINLLSLFLGTGIDRLCHVDFVLDA